MNRVKSLKSPQPELLDYSEVNLVFSRESVFFERKHPVIDRPMDIPEPARCAKRTVRHASDAVLFMCLT